MSIAMLLAFLMMVSPAQASPSDRYDPTRLHLSTMWTAVTLNMITADVLSVYIPESRAEFTDFANGRESELMLAGAIYYQLPISMVVLSQVLPYRINRWTNVATAGVVAAGIVGGGSLKPHYVVCATAELIGLTAITVKALRWREDEGTRLSLQLDGTSYGVTYTRRF